MYIHGIDDDEKEYKKFHKYIDELNKTCP